MGVLGIYWGVSGLRKKRNSAKKRKNHMPGSFWPKGKKVFLGAKKGFKLHFFALWPKTSRFLFDLPLISLIATDAY